MLLAQVEAGVGCPLSMTFAAVPALRRCNPISADGVDSSTDERRRALRHGDDRAPGRFRRARERDDGTQRRRTPGSSTATSGSAPRRCPTPSSCSRRRQPGSPASSSSGRKPGFRIERLKDKLGNRSNASAEIALDGAAASLVGAEGRGLHTILEMVNHTRLDCVLGSTALMRRAVAEATHHAAHRSAFGRMLAEQPLMRNVLADLCVESEAATVTALRLARAFDEADVPFRRLATAVAKFWICKRTPPLVAEALECLGGNGFVEESQLPRLFRESPLNSIWEGSGNVNALDVLRALAREPETGAAFLAEVRLAEGADPRLDAAIARLERELAEPDEEGARRLAGAARGLAAGLAARPPRRAGGRGRVLRVAARPAGRRLRNPSLHARLRSDRRAAPAAPRVECLAVAVEIQYCPV